jgi:hypothetical protein
MGDTGFHVEGDAVVFDIQPHRDEQRAKVLLEPGFLVCLGVSDLCDLCDQLFALDLRQIGQIDLSGFLPERL